MPPEDEPPAKRVPVDAERAFVLSDTLPDPASSLFFVPRQINEVLADALVVLDANTLLLPYGAGAASLRDVAGTFKALCKQERLYLPGQVVREFLRMRPAKIADLVQGIMDKVSQVRLPQVP